MTGAAHKNILLDGFRAGATPRTLFSRTPRLTIAQAFRAVTEHLPRHGTVTFMLHKGGISPDIHPFCTPEQAADHNGPEPTHLCYEILPQYSSAIIHRIKVAGQERQGTGTAMIASQYPFWRAMGVERLCVKAHGMSEGFYRALGFERADALPETPGCDGRILTLMQLDLRDREQAGKLVQAMTKHPAPTLKNRP